MENSEPHPTTRVHSRRPVLDDAAVTVGACGTWDVPPRRLRLYTQ